MTFVIVASQGLAILIYEDGGGRHIQTSRTDSQGTTVGAGDPTRSIATPEARDLDGKFGKNG
jgi:hypothetical protein